MVCELRNALLFLSIFVLFGIVLFLLKLQFLQLHYTCKKDKVNLTLLRWGKNLDNLADCYLKTNFNTPPLNTVKGEISWVLTSDHGMPQDGLYFRGLKLCLKRKVGKRLTFKGSLDFSALSPCAQIWTGSSCLSVRLRQYNPVTFRAPGFFPSAQASHLSRHC